MREINLTQGKIALIDDEDFDIISRHRWMAVLEKRTWYAVTIKSPIRRMHRLILKPKDGLSIDHINGNGLDNRRGNLRICLNSENAKNKRAYRTNKTGFKGVIWRKDRYKFIAKIRVDSKAIHLGYFDCPFKAARAYDEAAIKYHGEFASLNFPKK